MRDHEFDQLCDWLWDTRLRALSMTWLLCTIISLGVGYPLAVVHAAQDQGWYDTEACGGSDGLFIAVDNEGRETRIDAVGKHVTEGDKTGICNNVGTLVIKSDWSKDLGTAKIVMLFGFAPWLLVMFNFLLLNVRGYSRSVRLTWTNSATKRSLSERTKRLRAEELSAAAERRAAEMDKELEALGVPR